MLVRPRPRPTPIVADRGTSPPVDGLDLSAAAYFERAQNALHQRSHLPAKDCRFTPINKPLYWPRVALSPDGALDLPLLIRTQEHAPHSSFYQTLDVDLSPQVTIGREFRRLDGVSILLADSPSPVIVAIWREASVTP
jgi:hypothetical protein